MRYPDATWRPTEKHGYGDFDAHSQQGVVIHSAEGSLAGALSVLDGPRQASWHFFITTAGRIFQHVDTDHIAWTNGSYDANKLFWGIECEGRTGEPLTELQYQALVKLVRWLWATHQVGIFIRQQTLWEHREMTRFGSPSTSCPSGRIPWTALINEWEDDMPTQEEFEALKGEVAKLAGDLEGAYSQIAWLRVELRQEHQFDPSQDHTSAVYENIDWLRAHANDAAYHHSMDEIKAAVGGGLSLEEIAAGLNVEAK